MLGIHKVQDASIWRSIWRSTANISTWFFCWTRFVSLGNLRLVCCFSALTSYLHLVGFLIGTLCVKCDLVPAWATKGWLRLLSKEFPTLAFHASINKSFGKVFMIFHFSNYFWLLAIPRLSSFFSLQGSLLSVLRQFARLKSDKQAISVGFVGYPNVGKSSVINTLRTKNVNSHGIMDVKKCLMVKS